MKYSVILADPATNFDTYSEKGQGKSPSKHYQTMTIDDICSLPVSSMAAKDCALFLWTTWPRIFDAEKIIMSWGFTYSGLAWEWIKKNPETGKYAFGSGYGSRKNLEPCLLARRGSPKILNRSVRDFFFQPEDRPIFAPRREHSRKPDLQYERIERLYRGPYLEMFARQRWPGWDVWGNETSKFLTAGG